MKGKMTRVKIQETFGDKKETSGKMDKRKETLIIPNPFAMQSGDEISTVKLPRNPPKAALPKFTDNEREAYEWAFAFRSSYGDGVEASYAKVLAKYIERIK